MGVNGGSRILQRVREACTRGFTRPLSRPGKGVVLFASTNEVLSLVYRPSLTVRDVCIEAALIVNISPVALDFFTLVTENGQHYLNPQRVLFEEDCNQRYHFRLSFKACFGSEIRDFDREAFEYYFHQCRQDFLMGTLGQCTQENLKDFAELLILEVLYRANETHALSSKVVIENPRRYGIRRLFRRGVFREYPDEEIKKYLKDHIAVFENLGVDQIKSRFICILERADDFFVHKLSLEKAYVTKTVRKFEILVSAEFGIKKRRMDVENSYPEEIVKEFSEVEGLDLDPHSNKITIFRVNKRPEVLMSNSAEEIHSFTTLIEGYYRLMVNQYKELTKGKIRPKPVICHGPIERRKAELLLQQENRGDGFCLLRRKRNEHFSFVLSVCVTSDEILAVKHYEIVWDKRHGQFHLESDSSKMFSGLGELVEHYRQSRDGLPVCLKILCLPNIEGFSALLDRQVMASRAEDIHLVDDSFQIPLKDLNISRTTLSVQKGEFGMVRKGTWLCPASDEHVDVVSRALLKSAVGENVKELQKAIQQMSELQNPYLIQFLGIAETHKALIFVFEFGGEGPLDRYIKENSAKEHGITKGRVVSYAAQIAEGMMFLHSENCVHGRLMARNVIVANEECVKISDAGLLHILQKGLRFHQSKRGYGYNYCWFSPLALQTHTFSFPSDIWAFGMTLWEMFAMKEPFHSFTGIVLNEQQVMRRYLQGQYLNPNRPNCPNGVAELIKRCWAPVPEERISFRGLVAELQSPELVPEVEACQVLLPPNPSLPEEWEKEMFPQRVEMELHPVDRPGGSQVSDVDYSCLPAPDSYDNSNNGDSSSRIPESSSAFHTHVFESSGTRKRTLSKTFSHPGSPSEIVEALSCREPPLLLGLRKPSITRVSSCPPAIQLEDEVERQGEVRYVSTKSIHKASVAIQAKNSNPKLFPVLVSEATVEKDVSLSLEVSKYASGCQNNDDNNDDDDIDDDNDVEWKGHNKVVANIDDCFDDGNVSDESDDADSDTESNAELMAMRSLGIHITGTQDLSIQPIENLVSSGETIVDTTETDFEGIQSFDSMREHLEQMTETGSQVYVKVTSNQMAFSSDNRILDRTGFTEDQCSKVQSEPHSHGMHVAGSYVDLCSMNKARRSSDQLENSYSPEEPFSRLDPTKKQGINSSVYGAHSADKTSIQLSALVQHSLDDSTPKETDSDSPVLVQNNIISQTPTSNVGLEYTETVCQVRSEKDNNVQMTGNDVGMLESVSASPDEFLASLFSLHQQQTGPLPCPSTEFDVEPKEEAGNEMTEDNEERYCSHDAELSLGNLFSKFDGNRLQSSIHQYIPMEPLVCSEQKSNEFTERQHSVLKDEHPYFKDLTNPLDSADGFKSSVKVDKLNKNSGFAFPGAAIENHEGCPSIGFNILDKANNCSAIHQKTTEEHIDNGSSSLPPRLFELLWPSADVSAQECSTDDQLEHLEMDTISLNNLSKESSTEGLQFCDDHYSSQGSYSSYTNQFDEACAKGNGCVDIKHLADFTEGGVSEDFSSSEVQPGDAYKYHSSENLKRAATTSVKEQRATRVDGYSTNASISLQDHGTPYHQHVTHLEQELAQPLHHSPSSDSISSSEDIWSAVDLSLSQQLPSDLPESSSSSDVLERTSLRKTSLIGFEKEIVSKSAFDIRKIPHHLQVPYEQVRQKEFLGEGQFGKVNRAEIISTKHGKPQREAVAVKVLKKNASEKDSEDFEKEVENMIHIASKQNCDFIIKLRGVCIDKEDSLMLITELAPYGSLKTYLPKNKDILGISQLLEYSVQICKGMNYLEKQRLLHRDLATRNILVMQEDLVKISDFGLSRLENYYKTYGKGLFPLKWYALESITLGRFTPKSDVWSFGVTMWEIFTYGDTPYKDIEPSELHCFLEGGKRLFCPPSCPEKIYDLMRECWSEEAIKRPSFHLLCHKFEELQKVYAP